MRMLAYYSAKDNKFHSKRYGDDKNDEAMCKHDFKILKGANVPFLYMVHYNCYGAGGTRMKSYGLGFGAKIQISDLPENVREIVDRKLNKYAEDDYGGKSEFSYLIYESENWYGVWVDCGEDNFEEEVEIHLFITKDGSDTIVI